MASSHHYLLIFALCILYVESADPSYQLCDQNSNTTTPQIAKNIDSLLTKLTQSQSQSQSQSTFTFTSVGTGPARVFGLAQCRGDVPSQDCASCIQTAAKDIKTICPDRVDARVWYEYCLLRYDTNNFSGQVDTGYGIIYYNVANVTDPESFNDALGGLMYRINMLAGGPGSKGVGKGETKLSDFVTLYALSQCTEDLSELSCRQCLAIAIENFQTVCSDKKGCRVIYSSCYVRYELYPFFFPIDRKVALESSSVANYSSVVRKP